MEESYELMMQLYTESRVIGHQKNACLAIIGGCHLSSEIFKKLSTFFYRRISA